MTEKSHSSEHPSAGKGNPDQEEYKAPKAEEIETAVEPSETASGPGSSGVPVGIEESNRWD